MVRSMVKFDRKTLKNATNASLSPLVFYILFDGVYKLLHLCFNTFFRTYLTFRIRCCTSFFLSFFTFFPFDLSIRAMQRKLILIDYRSTFESHSQLLHFQVTSFIFTHNMNNFIIYMHFNNCE